VLVVRLFELSTRVEFTVRALVYGPGCRLRQVATGVLVAAHATCENYVTATCELWNASRRDVGLRVQSTNFRLIRNRKKCGKQFYVPL
jgi:hypothetical protein